jgi:hypothetical protein
MVPNGGISGTPAYAATTAPAGDLGDTKTRGQKTESDVSRFGLAIAGKSRQ